MLSGRINHKIKPIVTRIFIGIKCTEQEYLPVIQTKLKSILTRSQVNWVDPALFHITLKFLGEVEDTFIDSIVSTLHSISARFSPITLVPERVGTFGPKDRPRVLWFGYKPQADILELHKSIDEALADLGFMTEPKKFTPHLTVGRIKHIVEKDELNRYIQNQKTPVGKDLLVLSFQLYKSFLKQNGPEYHVLESFPLKM